MTIMNLIHYLLTFTIIVTVRGIPTNSSWNNGFSSRKNSNLIPLQHWGDKVYYMATQFTATWLDALKFCDAIGMKLLSIRSEAENSKVKNFIRQESKGTEYWSGGARLIDGKQWIWMPYAEIIDYTNWYYGQPADLNEKCLEIWIIGDQPLTWNDRHCDTRFYFICEKFMEPISHTSSL